MNSKSRGKFDQNPFIGSKDIAAKVWSESIHLFIRYHRPEDQWFCKRSPEI